MIFFEISAPDDHGGEAGGLPAPPGDAAPARDGRGPRD